MNQFEEQYKHLAKFCDKKKLTDFQTGKPLISFMNREALYVFLKEQLEINEIKHYINETKN